MGIDSLILLRPSYRFLLLHNSSEVVSLLFTEKYCSAVISLLCLKSSGLYGWKAGHTAQAYLHFPHRVL